MAKRVYFCKKIRTTPGKCPNICAGGRLDMQTAYTIILAPNPSIMTGPGTNTIILGGGAEGALVIDPAIDDNAYLDRLVQEGEKRGGIRRILITHGHSDHIGGALALRARLQVPIYAYSRE